MPAWTAPAARSNWNDELLASVCEAVRPHRPDGYGAARATLVANHDQLKTWVVTDGLTAVEAHELLGRLGVVVPERTLHRYALGGPRRGPLGPDHHRAGGGGKRLSS